MIFSVRVESWYCWGCSDWVGFVGCVVVRGMPAFRLAVSQPRFDPPAIGQSESTLAIARTDKPLRYRWLK